MEAMKMENEINATADGVVSSIAVKAGDVVNQGQALMSIE
jgi:biotin carboxyl carrier protein